MRKLVVAAVIGCLVPGAVFAQSAPLTKEEFTKLVAVVRPSERSEKWEQIPWRSNLWEARQQAAREGKPILLWEMDGHPLGCV